MDRALLAFTADGRPVGTAAAYSFELTLPGEVLEEVYDRYRRAQPGAQGRPHRWWA